MPFLPDIPQPTDYISLSQVQMLANNQTVNQTWGLEPFKNKNVGDHVPLETGAVTQLGRHKKTTLRSQGSDATTGSTELALYSKQISSVTEIVYRKPSDGTVISLTNNKTLFNGVSLVAYVVFDGNGNIITVSRPDFEGNLVDTAMSFNVATVSKTSGSDLYTVTYTTALRDNDYFWSVGLETNLAGSVNSGRIVVPKSDATYANSVATTFIKVATYNLGTGAIVNGETSKITLQIYSRT